MDGTGTKDSKRRMAEMWSIQCISVPVLVVPLDGKWREISTCFKCKMVQGTFFYILGNSGDSSGLVCQNNEEK